MATETTWTWAWPWWGVLVALNGIHVILGIILFLRSKKDPSDADRRYLRTMRTMGLIFILVACYRSIFVSSYLRQLAWFDSVLNSSLLIRSLAIFAELSFVGLIAKSLLRMNAEMPEFRETGGKFAAFLHTKTPILLFVCIAIANVFATIATVTKIDLLFALEETFWGLGFVSIIPTLILRMRRLASYRGSDAWESLRAFRTLTWVVAVFSIGYSIFELGFNLPIIYWPNAIAQLRMPVPDPAFRFGMQAVRDAFFVVHETRDLNAWGGMGFVVWHTGYFSLCVWMVLFLMTGPRRLKRD